MESKISTVPLLFSATRFENFQTHALLGLFNNFIKFSEKFKGDYLQMVAQH